MTRRAVMVLLVVALAAPLSAHEGMHEQIAQVTAEIVRRPHDAALFLKRAELYRLHGDWQEASRDYDRARRIDPALTAVDLGAGLLLLDRGRPAAALEPLHRYVKARDEDSRGHIALARALRSTGKPSEAAGEYAAALASIPRPEPELVLDHAHALVAAKRAGEALESLDTMQARLGPLVTLQLAAIEIEVSSGNYDAALRRVDAAETAAVRKETWLERRGNILHRAGRDAEARSAYQAALDALASLPAERRFTRAIQQLEERLHRALR
jgi:predicted Zn-dependent protease